MRRCMSSEACCCTLKGALACSMGATFATVVFLIVWLSATTSVLGLPSASSLSFTRIPGGGGGVATPADDGGYYYYMGTFDAERVEEAIARLIERFIMNATHGHHGLNASALEEDHHIFWNETL